jgi:hypothetical protein
VNLYELLRSAGDGEAFSKLAAQYGLAEADMRNAAAAFLPALSLALQRAAADPQTFLEVARRMMSPEYARAYRQPGKAGQADIGGLGFLFGSPETARAIADQAAAFAGLTQETMRALMPELAAMAIGGLADAGRKANPFLDAWLKAAEPSAAPAGKGPLDRYEEEQERRERKAAEDLAKAQAEMVRGGLAAFEAGAEAWRKALGGGAAAAKGPPAEMAKMFEPGLKVAEEYRRQIEALLNAGAKKGS